MTGPDDILRAAMADVAGINPTELAHRLAEAVRANRAAADEKAADPSAGPTEGPLLLQALDRAAVVGAFSPAELVQSLDDKSADLDDTQLISELLRKSHPAPGQPGLRMLNVSERRARLATLSETGQFDRIFAEMPLRPEDKLGEALRWKVQGGSDPFDPTPLPRASAGIADAAPDSDGPNFLGASPMPAGAALTQAMETLVQTAQVGSWVRQGDPAGHLVARTRIAQQMTEERVHQVASRFVGRDDLLARIQAALHDPNARSTAEIDGYPVIVGLHGIGGIGKSSLLAKLRERLLIEHPDMLFVRIDFDRPGFDSADLTFLTNEFMRQIARSTGDPELISAIWKFRPDTSARSRLRKQATTSAYEAATSSLESALSSLADSSSETWAFDRPISLLLDTFELRQSGGERQVAQIFEWLRALVAPPPSGSGLSNLSVLIAGRAPVQQSGSASLPLTSIEVDELSPGDARALLSMLGHSRDEVEVLAQVGGNPLLLHLVSRRVKAEGPLTRPKMAELLATEAVNDPELRQGVLYDRVLGHVRDPELRRLSYPGLLLRVISPEIIRDVLAPVCLDRRIEDAEAARLFAALRSEVWLVEEIATNVVRHRADIRRLMLPWMGRDPEVKTRSADLHNAAAKAYRLLGFDDEALFHEAMIAEPEHLARRFGPEDARRMLHAAKQDLEFLPAGVRSTLWAMTDDPKLTSADLPLLPPQLWDAATDKLGGIMIDRDDFRKALSIYKFRPKGAGSSPRLWHRRAEDAVVQWNTTAAKAYLDWTGPGTEDVLLRVEQAGLTALRLQQPADTLVPALAYATDELLESVLGLFPELAQQRLRGWHETLKDWGGLSPALRTEDRVHVARTLVYGGVGLFHLAPPGQTDVARSLLSKIIQRQIWDGIQLAQTDDGIAQQMPLAEEVRKLSVLGLCSDEKLLVSDAAIRPTRPWLEAVADDLDGKSKDLAAAWAVYCTDVLKGNSTVTQLTGTLPQAAADILNGGVIRGIDLRGPLYSGAGHPEYRAPLRSALTASELVTGDTQGLSDKLSVFQDLLHSLCFEAETVWPARLSDTRVGTLSAVEVERGLARLITFADQTGLLSRVIAGAADYWDDSEDLQELSINCRYWQQAMEGQLPRPA